MSLSQGNSDALQRKIERRLECISHILLLPTKSNLYIKSGKFIRTLTYGYLQENEIGRLYPEYKSIPYFPRDLRYVLFSSDYIDVDLVNSHPSILHHFCDNYMSLPAPVLESLVFDRESFRQKVAGEISSTAPGSSSEIKKKILVALNIVSDEFQSQSKLLKSLNSEVDLIRQAIFDYLVDSGRMGEM